MGLYTRILGHLAEFVRALAVVGLVLVWVVLFGVAAYFAVYFMVTQRFADASGWWQAAIELFGFPIILYGLFYGLPKRVGRDRLERPGLTGP